MKKLILNIWLEIGNWLFPHKGIMEIKEGVVKTVVYCADEKQLNELAMYIAQRNHTTLNV